MFPHKRDGGKATYIFSVQVQLVEYRLPSTVVQKEFHHHVGVWYIYLLHVELGTDCLYEGRPEA
jgi:hypothetical protein